MFRPQEKTQPACCYTFNEMGQEFRVVLFREHNTSSGAPRFRALITWRNQDDTKSEDGARVYTFRGSYSDGKEEAHEILLYMLEKWKENK